MEKGRFDKRSSPCQALQALFLTSHLTWFLTEELKLAIGGNLRPSRPKLSLYYG